MGGVLVRLAIAAVSAGLVCGCSTAPLAVGSIAEVPQSTPFSTGTPISAPTATAMPASSTAAEIPPGFMSFCIRFADQCQAAQNAPSAITLTDAAWLEIKKVNSAVNSAIWPEDDKDHYGRAEYWTIPTDGYGDCEDYALTKRKDLIDEGFPQPALRIAIVITQNESRHAVLTISTDKGDFVLDNLRNDVVAWNATGYTWIERQDPGRPMGWTSLQMPARQIATNDQSVATIVGPAQPASSIPTR